MAMDDEKLGRLVNQQALAKVAINMTIGIGHLALAIEALEAGNKEGMHSALNDAKGVARAMGEYFDELTGWTPDE